MPERDLRSNIQAILAFNAGISSATTTDGAIVDTAYYDRGVMFSIFAPVYTDGTFTVNLQDGDDPALSDAADIPDEKIIGDKSAISITAAQAQNVPLATLGITDTRRFVRIQIISAGTPDAHITSQCDRAAELIPVVNPDE